VPDNRQNQLACPECKHGDRLRKIEDFYRCAGCSNEWFDEEIIKVPYKTATFVDENGKVKYVPQTPEHIAKMKKVGAYERAAATRKSLFISKKDKNLLRRLRK
jgi:DNA-directed RNA polymerase subunit RPC12/RpoP